MRRPQNLKKNPTCFDKTAVFTKKNQIANWKFHNINHSTRKELLHLKILRFDFEN